MSFAAWKSGQFSERLCTCLIGLFPLAGEYPLTGGAGFIGSHLTDALLGRGDEVWVMADLSAGRASRLHEKAVLFDHSIMHAKELAGLAEDMRPELICHLAAQIDVRTSVEFPALRGQRPIIYGDGRQTRDFVYVSDVVEAFLAAADCGMPGAWNIGTGVEVSVLDLAAVIGEISGRPFDPEFAPPRAGELERSAVSAELARRDLDSLPLGPLGA